MAASMNGNTDIVVILIKNNASIDIQNKAGHTALILAVIERRIKHFRILLDSGASVNVQDNEGKTALMHAVINKRSYYEFKVVELLLDYKPLVSMQDKEGENALKYAEKYRYMEPSRYRYMNPSSTASMKKIAKKNNFFLYYICLFIGEIKTFFYFFNIFVFLNNNV